MRRAFLLLLLGALASASVLAQKKSLGQKHLDWGLQIGANVSTLRTDNTEDHWKAGFVTGLYFRIHPACMLTIQPEFLYSSMGSKRSGAGTEDISLRLNYFSIPLLLKYQAMKHLSIVAGPQFDFLMQAKEVNGGEAEKLYNTYNDKSIIATAGIDYWPCAYAVLCARYMHGFTDISADNNPQRHQGVQITLALKL